MFGRRVRRPYDIHMLSRFSVRAVPSFSRRGEARLARSHSCRRCTSLQRIGWLIGQQFAIHKCALFRRREYGDR